MSECLDALPLGEGVFVLTDRLLMELLAELVEPRTQPLGVLVDHDGRKHRSSLTRLVLRDGAQVLTEYLSMMGVAHREADDLTGLGVGDSPSLARRGHQEPVQPIVDLGRGRQSAWELCSLAGPLPDDQGLRRHP